MAVGSFASSALVDLDSDDLRRMLKLDESLFVEHKRDIGADSSFQIVKAVGSFANSYGGWLLIGIHGEAPLTDDAEWADPAGLPLVDRIRDCLRGELDPLPAFEARVLEAEGRPVGVIRVYESSDTPHVAIRTGAIFVREVAGDSNVAANRSPGTGAKAAHRYLATAIRSQAQLAQLAAKGERARERVESLLAPSAAATPLATGRIGLEYDMTVGGLRPRTLSDGQLFVRAIPYTVAPRFRSWSTTTAAASAAMAATEDLAQRFGHSADFLQPHPAGVSMRTETVAGRFHSDVSGGNLRAWPSVAIDGAGVVAAALRLEGPDAERRASWGTVDLATRLIVPLISTVVGLLLAGEFLGRTRLQIDVVGLSAALRLERVERWGDWVPVSADLALPPAEADVQHIAVLAANACARSGGVPAWDGPAPGTR